jgi:tetratricopeptide (TPR) repeat protein
LSRLQLEGKGTFVVFDDILAKHFPPPLGLSPDEQIKHKSKLIIEARARKSAGDAEGATLLFHQAATIEEHLAASLAADGSAAAPKRSTRWISAATCYGLAGDLERASRLFGEWRRSLDEDSAAFAESVHRKRKKARRAAVELAQAWAARDLTQVRTIGRRAIGLLSPRVRLWPCYRLADARNDRALAIAALKKLIVHLPSRAEFHLLYAAELRTDQAREGLAHIDRIQTSFARDYRLLSTRASVLLALGETRNAIREAQAALVLRDDAQEKSDAFTALAFVTATAGYRRIGDLERALAIASDSTQALPADAELATMHGLILLSAGRYDDAEQVLENAASKPAVKSHWPVTFLGALLVKREMWRSAESVLTRAVATSTGTIRAKNLNNLGVAFAQQGNLAAAIEQFRLALGTAPELRVASVNLSVTETEAGTTGPMRYEALDLHDEWEHFEVLGVPLHLDEAA